MWKYTEKACKNFQNAKISKNRKSIFRWNDEKEQYNLTSIGDIDYNFQKRDVYVYILSNNFFNSRAIAFLYDR